ncbi:hypothetical protein AMQ83_30085 [Paenibacillus riograndensis]|nr:hypothetical protein AMQ83_30085 [Paenibacillus riograndensis]
MKTMHENVKGTINISHQAIAKIASSAIQTIREVTAVEGSPVLWKLCRKSKEGLNWLRTFLGADCGCCYSN